MTRKEGYIEVDKMLEKIGVDTTDLDTILCSPLINIIKDSSRGIHFSFEYQGETYFYKHSFFVVWGAKVIMNPYNELIVGELAKDFDISCVDYDLAVLKNNKGVISKNFKKKDAKYNLGEEILKGNIEYYNSGFDDNIIKESRLPQNTLDDIWDKLEIYYHNNPNKKDIVRYLMNQIVNIYLFDVITCQQDRHDNNWQIVELDQNIDVAPLYDNEIILNNNVMLLAVDSVKEDNIDIWNSIKKFQKISSSEFTNIIKDKLWIISEENLNKVFERIEKKTGYPMPKERKDFYLNNYQEHKKRLEEILGNEDVRKR